MRILLFIIVFICTITIWKYDLLYYPVKEINIETSDKRFNENNIYNYLDNLYDKNLLKLDINDIKAYITQDRWINDAVISKIFPGTLNIRIIEHKPMANYNSDVLTAIGELIPDSSLENLPNIRDYTNNHIQSHKIYSEISEKLSIIGLSIQKIEIYHSLVKIYTQKTILISDNENLYMNIERLLISFNKLKEVYKKEISSIDMRYSNGFAIK